MRKTLRQPHVGQRLRELRERAGLSRAQLSDATGVTTSAIFRLENGDDVRLSTYFPIMDHFIDIDPQRWMVPEQVVLMSLGLPREDDHG